MKRDRTWRRGGKFTDTCRGDSSRDIFVQDSIRESISQELTKTKIWRAWGLLWGSPRTTGHLGPRIWPLVTVTRPISDALLERSFTPVLWRGGNLHQKETLNEHVGREVIADLSLSLPPFSCLGTKKGVGQKDWEIMGYWSHFLCLNHRCLLFEKVH